jgi:VanZ family protein
VRSDIQKSLEISSDGLEHRETLTATTSEIFSLTIREQNLPLHRIRTGAKACCVLIVILLLVAALGPAQWAPRTELGWQFDHFIGYFGITLFFCVAWPRPFVVGGILMVVAVLLEALQALTPDRSANLEAALWGAGGALVAGLTAELFIRVWRLRARRKAAQ